MGTGRGAGFFWFKGICLQARERISEEAKRSTFSQILRNKLTEDDDSLNAEKRMSSFTHILRKDLAEGATDQDKR